jgi:hypothetical protein
VALTFPNRSRSYDETGQRIRFRGYDGMFEVPFFIAVDALSATRPQTQRSERGYLAAFDVLSESIYSAARNAYSHGRKTMYVLTAADLR